MTATIRIVTDQRDDVVRVPDQALRYVPGGMERRSAIEDGRQQAVGEASQAQVWVLRDGTAGTGPCRRRPRRRQLYGDRAGRPEAWRSGVIARTGAPRSR